MNRIKSGLTAIVICIGLLLAGGAGGAVAGGLITGQDIKDGSITSRDVQDRTIKRKDINFHFAGKYRTERQLRELQTQVGNLRSVNEAQTQDYQRLARLVYRLANQVRDLEAAAAATE